MSLSYLVARCLTLSILGPALAAVPTAKTATLCLTDFGADATGHRDSASAFARLLRAGAARRHLQIAIPPGRFRLASRVVVRLAGNQTNLGLTISGAGEDTTELLVDNSDGGLLIRGDGINRLSVTVRDLSVVAVREAAGTAVEFALPNPGDHHSRQFTAQNLLVRGERFDQGYFRHGLVIRNAWYPRLENVKVTDRYGPDVADLPDAERMACALTLEDCYSPLVTNCYVWGSLTALTHRAVRSSPEDGIVADSYFVGCARGLVVAPGPDPSRWEEPAFHIRGCHINYRDVGVLLQGVRQAFITECLFYCHDWQGSAWQPGPPRDMEPVDVDLAYASDVIVANCIFTEPSNPRRVAVRIGAASGHVTIQGNQFNLEGTALRNESVLPSYAAGNTFGGRRDFSGGLKRYDDRTGSLVTTDPGKAP